METFPGHPLFDNAVRAIKANGSLDEYPTLKQFLDLAPEGALRDWEQAQRFLISYASTSGTYSRFRGEIQRFLLFLWLQQGKTLLDADDEDINQYMGFIKSPPASWIGSGRFASFIDQSGVRVANEKWRPFFGNTEIKQATLDASKVCLQTFFRVLVSRRYLPFSPMAHARKSAQRANRSENGLDDDDLTAPRLTDWQWAYLLESLLHAASQDAKFERHLFVVVTMKTLYLRVHELAPRKNDLTGETYQPTMGDFRQKVVGSDKY